jgi:hypothetical protein
VTPNPLTPSAVRAYLEQSERATEGPWRYNPLKCYRPGVAGAKPVLTDQEGVFSSTPDGSPTIALTGESNDPQSMADAAFIAASRTMGPALAREWLALREEVDAALDLLRSSGVFQSLGLREAVAARNETLDIALRHLHELEATLENERGAGEGPSPGWRATSTTNWSRGEPGQNYASVSRGSINPGGKPWRLYVNGRESDHESARAAMRAALTPTEER